MSLNVIWRAVAYSTDQYKPQSPRLREVLESALQEVKS